MRAGRFDPFLVALAALASRLPYLTHVEQDLDGSRFVRGVMRFDLVQGHPHPPGYPVYIGLAAALDRALLRAPALALSFASALGFALLAALTCALGRRLADGSRGAGVLAAIALPLGTGIAVLSTRPLSDMLGIALAWAVVAAGVRALGPLRGSRNAALLGIAAFGLLCGTRLSTLPLALPALGVCLWRTWRAQARTHAALIASASVLVWLAPLVALAGGVCRLATLTLAQGRGHFERFGGSALTDHDVTGRARAVVFGIWTHVLGGAWSDRPRVLLAWSFAIFALLALGARAWARLLREGRRDAGLLLACAGVYAPWAFFGQNVVWQPRHLVPLAPVLAIGFALGARAALLRARHRISRAVLGLALALCGTTAALESHRVGVIQARQMPPTLRLARHLKAAVAPGRSLVATTQLETWLRFRAPNHRVRRVRSAEEARALGERAGLVVYVTSEVPGAFDLSPPPTRVFHALHDRYVSPALYDIALLRVPYRRDAMSPTHPDR